MSSAPFQFQPTSKSYTFKGNEYLVKYTYAKRQDGPHHRKSEEDKFATFYKNENEIYKLEINQYYSNDPCILFLEHENTLYFTINQSHGLISVYNIDGNLVSQNKKTDTFYEEFILSDCGNYVIIPSWLWHPISLLIVVKKEVFFERPELNLTGKSIWKDDEEITKDGLMSIYQYNQTNGLTPDAATDKLEDLGVNEYWFPEVCGKGFYYKGELYTWDKFYDKSYCK